VFGVFFLAISFVISLFLPAMSGEGGFFDEGVETKGYVLLCRGWLYMPFAVVWLANPLFVIAIVGVIRSAFWAIIVAGVSFLLSVIPFVLFATSWEWKIRFDWPVSIVFGNGKLRLEMGYLMWVGCHALLLVMAVTAFIIRKRRERIIREYYQP
jgi:hypothetical protein